MVGAEPTVIDAHVCAASRQCLTAAQIVGVCAAASSGAVPLLQAVEHCHAQFNVHAALVESTGRLLQPEEFRLGLGERRAGLRLWVCFAMRTTGAVPSWPGALLGTGRPHVHYLVEVLYSIGCLGVSLGVLGWKPSSSGSNACLLLLACGCWCPFRGVVGTVPEKVVVSRRRGWCAACSSRLGRHHAGCAWVRRVSLPTQSGLAVSAAAPAPKSFLRRGCSMCGAACCLRKRLPQHNCTRLLCCVSCAAAGKG